MKIKLSILFALISIVCYPQHQQFSPFSESHKQEVIEISKEIIQLINSKDFTSLESYLTNNETNLQGQLWLKNGEYLKLLKSLSTGITFNEDESAAYTFDDVLSGTLRKQVSIDLYRVFSDLNILVRGKYIDLKDSAKYDYSLVYGKFDDRWKLTAIHLSNVNLMIKHTNDLTGFRVEQIEEMNISVPIPPNFSERQIDGNMITFVLKGETPRDAAVQIVSVELKAPIEFMTYKWAEYVALSRYDNSSFRARLHPLGIIYEYKIIDENGDKNKGITVGIEINDKVVFLQYFSFLETYDNIWREIDLMIRNIGVINEL